MTENENNEAMKEIFPDDEETTEDLAKRPWKSVTVWTAVVVALAPLCPPVGAWVAANPALASAVVSGVFALIRMFTKKPISVRARTDANVPAGN